MHERVIVENLVEQVIAKASDRGISQVTRILVRIGEAGHLTKDSLSMWFDVLKAGTIAEQAALEVESAEGTDVMLMSIEGEVPDD